MFTLFFFSCLNENQSHKNTDFSTSPYEPQVENTFTSINAEELAFFETALQQTLSNWHGSLYQTSALHILDQYPAVMNYSSSGCPANYSYNGNEFWYADCISASDAYFHGYLFYDTYTDVDIFGDGGLYDGWSLAGNARVLTNYSTETDPNIYEWGGNTLYVEGSRDDGAEIYYLVTAGSFLFLTQSTSELSEDMISQDEILLQKELAQYIAIYEEPTYMLRLYVLNGSIPISDETSSTDLQIQALSFRNVQFINQGFGYPCEAEPIGSSSG